VTYYSDRILTRVSPIERIAFERIRKREATNQNKTMIQRIGPGDPYSLIKGGTILFTNLLNQNKIAVSINNPWPVPVANWDDPVGWSPNLLFPKPGTYFSRGLAGLVLTTRGRPSCSSVWDWAAVCRRCGSLAGGKVHTRVGPVRVVEGVHSDAKAFRCRLWFQTHSWHPYNLVEDSGKRTTT